MCIRDRGDIGPSAARFVDFLGTSGLSLWQMLPVGPAGEGNCPYQSMSAFGGDPLLVSPDRLVVQGFLESFDIEHYISSNDGKVNYPAAEELKTRLLRRAFENFENKPQGQSQIDFNAFKHMESYWLDDFSLFLAIQTKEGTSNWTRWSQELKTRQLDAIIAVQKDLGAEIRYHEFVQWQFAVQWNELKVYCKSKGIRLIGDIPMFVAHQSADAVSYTHLDVYKRQIFGYITALLASFLIDREVKDPRPEIAYQKSVQALQEEIIQLRRLIEDTFQQESFPKIRSKNKTESILP